MVPRITPKCPLASITTARGRMNSGVTDHCLCVVGSPMTITMRRYVNLPFCARCTPPLTILEKPCPSFRLGKVVGLRCAPPHLAPSSSTSPNEPPPLDYPRGPFPVHFSPLPRFALRADRKFVPPLLVFHQRFSPTCPAFS